MHRRNINLAFSNYTILLHSGKSACSVRRCNGARDVPPAAATKLQTTRVFSHAPPQSNALRAGMSRAPLPI
jgi:hypothetical protein